MPPIRTAPVKTERTHEENQERAYIAASRRSDRSLEARIESARRASEIHKRRTGRALRVTEQDVINEEMYEEEDDDLPTQYQRLSAHLHSGSIMFNKKLQDYIATQAGVRNGFMQQYNFPIFGQQPYASNGGQLQAGMSPYLNQMSPVFSQSPQSLAQPQQGFAYPMNNRAQMHQRSASIPMPQQMQGFQQPTQSNLRPEDHRRSSMPSPAFDQPSPHMYDGTPRPAMSRSSTSQSLHQQPVSPHPLSSRQEATSSSTSPTSAHGSPISQQTHNTPFTPMGYVTGSHTPNILPLTMSLPPESQQLVGPGLDPNDPSTAMFMAGSHNLPQPFTGTYHYNPNLSPKPVQTTSTSAPGLVTNSMPSTGMNQTLSPAATLKLDTNTHSSVSINPLSPFMSANVADYGFGNLNDQFFSNEYIQTPDEFDDHAYIDYNE